MADIQQFPFDLKGAGAIRQYKFGRSWPVVYILENSRKMYVGESTHVYLRAKQHIVDEKKSELRGSRIHIISDEEYNKSASLDTEASLIEYLAADGQYVLLNKNEGQQNHNYYDREKYKAKFELLWEELRAIKLAKNSLVHIRNTDLFKYSPYKTLTPEQLDVADQIFDEMRIEGLEKFKLNDSQQNFIVHGGPGTGKTILAVFIMKYLVDQGYDNIALVIAMVSLRKTLKKVFRNVKGLSPSMVKGPNEIAGKKFDVLVVDEAHRLRQRKNIPNYGTHDATNKKLGLGSNGTELDWVLKSTNKTILFYDERQSVKPADIDPNSIKGLQASLFKLNAQVRVKGGDQYLEFIDSVLELNDKVKPNFDNYDFQIFDQIEDLIKAVKEKEAQHQLSRVVSGFAWPWHSKKSKKTPDIVIGKTELFWNSVIHDWVNSPNAINEVGCIHTIQGYDLNYAGVILGAEIKFDLEKQEIVIDKKAYYDKNGKNGILDESELKRYIINIYKTLLTRGILGTYVYIVDKSLRDYFKSRIGK